MSDKRPDGQRERTFRTRKLLIEAYINVAGEKKRIPKTGEVALRAGVSQRSVFERFGSLDALSLAAFDHILEPSMSTGDLGKADRQARIRFQVDVRARSCETWLPVWRLVASAHGTSQALEERVEEVRALTRGRLELMYRPELDTLSEPARIAVLIALEALTDWACWGRMREHYGHSFDQACKRVDRGDRAPAAADSRLLNRRDINRARPDAGGPVDHEALLQRNASATACTISSLP